MKSHPPAQPWLHYARLSKSPRLRLFCLPHAGGAAGMYRAWAPFLPADLDFCPVQLPGRENRFGEPPEDDPDRLVASLCQALTPLLDRPYAVFGYSMGGLLAHAWVQRLRQLGQPLPQALVVAACSSPEQPPTADVDTLDDAGFIEHLRELGGTPDAVLAHEELMELLLPLLRADFRLVRRLRLKSYDLALPCPLFAFAAREDQRARPAEVATWRTRTSGVFRCLEVPGGHFDMLNDPRAMVARVSAVLAGE